MKQLLDVMAEYGLHPIDLIVDGKLNRFAASPDDKKKSGWAFVWQNHTLKSGESYYTAVFGNHRTGDQVVYHDENVKFSREDKKNIREQAERARKLAQEQREVSE